MYKCHDVFKLQLGVSKAAQTMDGWADGGSEIFMRHKIHKGKA